MAIHLADLQLSQSSPDESMKTKFIPVLLILYRITIQAGFCQIDYCCFDTNEIYSEQPLSGEVFSPASPPDTITYFNKNWLTGDIWLTDGRIVRNKIIKYNRLFDELFWFELKSNKTIKLDKEAILQFHFLNFHGDTTVHFKKIKVKKENYIDSAEIFVQEICHVNISLFISHSLYFTGTETVWKNNNYILKAIYKEAPVYYLKSLNSRIVGFKRISRKNLYTFMPDKKDQIKKYFSDSVSGKIQTKQEILSLIAFLSSIAD
jgi:hypothetical protein